MNLPAYKNLCVKPCQYHSSHWCPPVYFDFTERMASAQLIVKTKSQMTSSSKSTDDSSSSSSSTAVQVEALTINLSEKTKVTAQPGDKWKAGYLTVSRASKVKSGWRNVHISKKSFEKLGQEMSNFRDAMKARTHHHLMLTKKQHVLTTKFVPEGKETLYYISLMHPVKDCDVVKGDDAMNHAKTINFSENEFDKFCEVYEKLSDVVKSKTNTGDGDDGGQLVGYRWTYKPTGARSPMIFLSLDQCEKDSSIHYFDINAFEGQPMEYDYQCHYDYYKVPIDRPSKLQVIEHCAYANLLQILKTMNIEVEDIPPGEKAVDTAIEQFHYPTFKVLVKKVLLKLSYKNVYLTGELVDMFAYFGSMEKVKACLVKHHVSAAGKTNTRLIDHCFGIVYEEVNKE